jgi:hypothetical protein
VQIMAKHKSRSKAKKTAPARDKPAQLAVGARVRVKLGVWGNSTGTVAGLSSAGVLVRLDTARNMDAIPFDSTNLVEGGALDRF